MNQASSANTHRNNAAVVKPRKWRPTPKTSVPATMVKKEKTRRGLNRSDRKACLNLKNRKIVINANQGLGDKVDRKERIGPFPMAFEEQGIRDDPGSHYQGEAAGIERLDLTIGPRA